MRDILVTVLVTIVLVRPLSASGEYETVARLELALAIKSFVKLNVYSYSYYIATIPLWDLQIICFYVAVYCTYV